VETRKVKLFLMFTIIELLMKNENKMKKLLLCMIMSSFSVTSIAQFKHIDFKKRNYEELPLNIILKSEIGDKLITTGEEEFQEALKIVEIPEFNIDFSLFFRLNTQT
jgi:hypothetical protein